MDFKIQKGDGSHTFVQIPAKVPKHVNTCLEAWPIGRIDDRVRIWELNQKDINKISDVITELGIRMHEHKLMY